MNPYDHIIIMATLDKNGILTLDTCMNTFLTDSNFTYEYILSILNSKVASWYYYWFVYNRAVRTMHSDEYYIGKLPVKVIPLENQQPFITLVDQIIAAKTTPTSAPLLIKEGNKGVVDTSALEREVDEMVYKLYGLTDEEIAIVEEKR